MLQRPFPKLKKHHPTRLYMLYPMLQSVALVCIEIDKQMPPQWHCPLSIFHCHWKSIAIRNHFSIQILNFDLIVSKIESIIKLNFELCHTLIHTSRCHCQPKTPQRDNQKPYRHGTGALRHYPHTLIRSRGAQYR